MKWKKAITPGSGTSKRGFVNLGLFREAPKIRSASRPLVVSTREGKARFFQKLLTGMWDRDNRRC